MNEEIKEIKIEDPSLLDYMLIPIKEYRQLIADNAKLKAQVLEYFNQSELYKNLVAEYKHDIHQVLGIKELQQVKEEKNAQCL